MVKNVKGSPITTVIGVMLLITVPLMVFFGVITADQSDQAQSYLTQLIDAISTHSWTTIITVVLGVIGMLMKDPKFAKK
jgi:hypothetical protein